MKIIMGQIEFKDQKHVMRYNAADGHHYPWIDPNIPPECWVYPGYEEIEYTGEDPMAYAEEMLLKTGKDYVIPDLYQGVVDLKFQSEIDTPKGRINYV